MQAPAVTGVLEHAADLTSQLQIAPTDQLNHVAQRVVVVTSDHPAADQPRVFIIKLPSDVLHDVMARAHTVRPVSEAGLVERVVREVSTGAAPAAATEDYPDDDGPTGSRQAMLTRAKAYIEEHLADDDLTPDKVAAGIFVSKRYLYMLFEHEPRSVSRHIIVRRLETIADRLVDPGSAHLSAADIAMRTGFKDPSHFARAFKAEYGVTPGRFRVDQRPVGAA